MATPSVLTVPSMYGDGILYSGPTAYGNQLITNGNFQTDTDWTKGAGVTISNGNANFINAPDVALYQNIGTQSGFVRVEFNITEYTSGTLNVYSGGNQSVGTINVVGNKIGRYTAKVDRNGGNNNIIFGSSDNFTGSITNVSVKEITQGSDFDFTRATTGTRINEEGYIEDVPYNLAFYSEDISQWDNFRVGVQLSNIISPLNSTSVYLLEDGAQTDNHYRKLDYATLDPNNTYTQSFFVKKKDNGIYPVLRTSGIGGDSWVTFNWDTETLVQGSQITSSKVEKLNAGWYRISMVFSGLASTGFIIGMSNDPNDDLPTYTGNFNRFYAWGCQIVKGDKIKNYLPTTDRKNLPRLNYPVYGGCPSLLLEPQRTNSIPHSTDFSNAAWTKNEVTVTANSIISPEGITNASLIKESSANSLHWLGDAVSVTSGTSYSASVYAKKKERSVFQWTLSTNFLNASFANYDLDKGVVSATGGAVTAQIIAMPNDWYRCIITFTATSTNTGTPLLSLQDSPTAARGAAYQGDGSSGLYLYGAQFEAGSYATSLIHTSGSTETRNQDVAVNAGLGTTNTFNSSEGVLYAEIQALADDNTERRITISNSSNTAELITIEYDTPSNTLHAFLYNGSFQAEFTYVTDITQLAKVAFKYKENDFAFWVNGVQVDSDNNGSVFANNTLNILKFENSTSSNKPFYGNVKAVAVYKTALADTELANLTSYNNHDLFIPYRSRMQMISADQELQCTEHDITRFL